MLFKVSTTTTRIVIKRMRVVDEVRPGRLVYPEAVHHQTIDGACAWWSGRSTRHYSRHRSLIRITMRSGALQEEKVVEKVNSSMVVFITGNMVSACAFCGRHPAR